MLHFFLFKTISLNKIGGGVHEKLELPPLEINEKSVAGYCGLHRKSINVADVYHDESFDWSGPKKYDKINGYKTKSMLVIPLIDKENELIGVMQLINAKKDNDIIPFTKDVEYVITSLASQCAILLSNMLLLENIQTLLNSFVDAMVTAIESRTPYNANHTKNVSKLCSDFVDYLIANNVYEISKNDKEQLVMGAMLHDIGKMIVPLSIMNKSSRLESKIELMRVRWNLIRLDLENKYLKNVYDLEKYNEKLNEFDKACEFIELINTIGFMDLEKQNHAKDIIKLEYDTSFGKLKVVENDEEEDVLIIKGTLTSDERHEIEKHALYTKLILDRIDFGKKYNNVLYIAGAHHEYLDGSGYPNKYDSSKLSILVRILTIMDVFESLTSVDRPYKKPMPKDRAYRILCEMVKEGKLDENLVKYLGKFIGVEE
jgi:HD-GYP domain-containing protein (c-di-GMP phosphodiesterase class II)